MLPVLSYEEMKNRIGNGDLVETHTNGVAGSVIRFFTGEIVNHSTMALVQRLDGSDYKRRYIIEADGGPVHQVPFSEYIKKHSGNLYWSPVKSMFHCRRRFLAQAAVELEGIPYDWKSLFSLAVREVNYDSKRLLCSEMIQVAAVWSGLILPSFNKRKILKPGQLHTTGVWESPSLIIT